MNHCQLNITPLISHLYKPQSGEAVVGCLKINEDKSSKSRVQTPDAGLIIAIAAIPRREGRNPRLSITAAPRRESRNPRLGITAAPRREGRNPRLSCNCPCYGVNHGPHNKEVNPYYGAFLGGTFTSGTSINNPSCY